MRVDSAKRMLTGFVAVVVLSAALVAAGCKKDAPDATAPVGNASATTPNPTTPRSTPDPRAEVPPPGRPRAATP